MMQQNHTNGRLTDRERTPARLIVLRVLFTLFAAGTVVFIFSNSMQSGTASGLRSAAVTESFANARRNIPSKGITSLLATTSTTVPLSGLRHSANHKPQACAAILTVRAVYSARIAA